MRRFRVAFVCFLVFLDFNFLQAYDYYVEKEGENLIEYCTEEDDKGNVDLRTVLDVSELNRMIDPTSEVSYSTGDVIVKVPMPKDAPIKAEIEVYRWKRNKWEQTIFSIRRDNFCNSLFNPFEIWYSVVKSVPEDQRACPPVVGTRYTLTNATSKFELPNVPTNDLNGRYKSIVHFSVAEYVVCMAITVNIERKM